jgi:hypothetical protein
VARSGLEILGDTRRHVSIREQRLRVAGRNDVQLAGVVELADRVQRMSAVRRSECEGRLELGALSLCRTPSGQEAVRVLARDAELPGEIGDRQPLAP